MKNKQREFDDLQKIKLGKYVYALKDPIENVVFYVGQGRNDRLFDHFNEAEKCDKNTKKSDKVEKILSIWKKNYDCDWFIIAHDLQNDKVMDIVESAIYDVSMKNSISLLNTNSPPKSTMLLKDEIDEFSAEIVNPKIPIKNVFVFSIYKALEKGGDAYSSTRSSWRVTEDNRNLNLSFGIGIRNNISKGSYTIDHWKNKENKFEFFSKEHPDCNLFEPLYNKKWDNILEKANRSRGNYIIVDFDGNGSFKITRHCKKEFKDKWHKCIK
tara:strand:+ start:103 stop:909 length:807 start_codon:yes stop_codon:yes gene_type:complete